MRRRGRAMSGNKDRRRAAHLLALLDILGRQIETKTPKRDAFEQVREVVRRIADGTV